jgi:hypothetical protein
MCRIPREKIDFLVLVPDRIVHNADAASTDTRRDGIGDRQRKIHRRCGVSGAAAFRQKCRTCPNGNRLIADHQSCRLCIGLFAATEQRTTSEQQETGHAGETFQAIHQGINILICASAGNGRTALFLR